MTVHICPNCFSENFRTVIFSSYDPGYIYSCDHCSHDFDIPAEEKGPKDIFSDDDNNYIENEYDEVI